MKKLFIILALALLAGGCRKDGKERYAVDPKNEHPLDIKKGEQRRGIAPYYVRAVFFHAVKHDDAEYTIISSDSLVTLNIEDNLLKPYFVRIDN